MAIEIEGIGAFDEPDRRRKGLVLLSAGPATRCEGIFTRLRNTGVGDTLWNGDVVWIAPTNRVSSP